MSRRTSFVSSFSWHYAKWDGFPRFRLASRQFGRVSSAILIGTAPSWTSSPAPAWHRASQDEFPAPVWHRASLDEFLHPVFWNHANVDELTRSRLASCQV